MDEIQAAATRSGLSRRALLNGAGVASVSTVAAAMAPGTADAAVQPAVDLGSPTPLPREPRTASVALYQLRLPTGEAETFSELVEMAIEINADDYVEAWERGSTAGPVGVFRPDSTTPKAVRVTLRSGLTTTTVKPTSALWQWMQTARAGNMRDAVGDVILEMFDAEGTRIGGYTLIDCLPLKHAITGAKAGGADLLIQTLTLIARDIG